MIVTTFDVVGKCLRECYSSDPNVLTNTPIT